eukprot:4668509-Lingulodinium_polyedra.AAC.1
MASSSKSAWTDDGDWHLQSTPFQPRMAHGLARITRKPRGTVAKLQGVPFAEQHAPIKPSKR